MAGTTHLPSDDDLVAATRVGSDAAWSELRERHADAIGAVARRRGRLPRGSRTVEQALYRLWIMVSTEDPPPPPPTPAVRAVCPRMLACLTGGHYGPATESPGSKDPDPGGTTLGDREREDVAEAFGRLPGSWQTVLWHRLVEHAPAATITAILGRSAAQVVALEQTARRGLFDAYTDVVMTSAVPPAPGCRMIVPLLGAFRRGTLPAPQTRLVEAHLTGPGRSTAGSHVPLTSGCERCRRRADLPDRFDDVVPAAIVPALVGSDALAFRTAVGAGTLTVGSTAFAARRSDRAGRAARVTAAVALLLAILGAAYFIREPLGGLDDGVSDLLDRPPTTTVMPDPSTSLPAAGAETNRIDLVFRDGLEGAVYVPGGRAPNISVTLSTPAPVYAGATGTVDVAITNGDAREATASFGIDMSPGVSFEGLTDGGGSCRVGAGGAARCTVTLGPSSGVSMALRFVVAADAPDRLRVTTNVGDASLQVPVAYVDGLVLGEVGRGTIVSVGDSLGSCVSSPACPSGRRDASSATVEIPSGSTVDRALLLWEGADETGVWAHQVGLMVPGSTRASTVERVSGEQERRRAGTGFLSGADVTEMVRAGGSGRYTVVRAPSVEDPGDGSWTLIVVTTSPAEPRRLFVSLRPDRQVTVGSPYRIDLPVAGPVVPVTPRRRGVVARQIAAEADARVRFGVEGAVLAVRAPDGGRDGQGASTAYDLQIASTEDVLTLQLATTSGAVRLAAVGLSLDIVS